MSTLVPVPNEVPIAVQVKADYTPGPQTKKKGGPVLKLTKGQLGWAFKSTRSSGWVLCQLDPDTPNEKIGWIDEKYLNPGKDKVPIGELKIEKPQAQKPGPAPPDLPGQGTSCLEKAIAELWRMIKANRTMLENELPTLKEIPVVNERIFGPGADHYASLIIKALNDPEHKRFRQAVEDGHSDVLCLADPGRLNDIITANSQGRDMPRQPGIYARIYPELQGANNYWIFKYLDPKPDTGCYFGQVSEAYRWPGRREQHNRAMDENKLAHYKLANTMADFDSRVMVPALTFNPNGPAIAALGLETVLDAAELTFVCLFRTWHPILLGPDHNLNQMASHYESFRSAKAFNAIMDTVKASTGWNPTQIVGCNFLTPMVTGRLLERLWCTWYDTEKRTTIFRARRRLYMNFTNKDGSLKEAVVRLSSTIALYVPLELIKEAGITKPRQVNVVVEFTDGGDHDYMYVRFPRLGPNPAFEILRTMGIRIEYVDDNGKWWTALVTRGSLWGVGESAEAKAANIPDSYRHGMGIATSLLCLSWTNAPKWLEQYSLGMISIKKFVYDHLGQQITVEAPSTSTKPWPADRTIEQNKALIKEEVRANDWDTTVGSRDLGKLKKYQHGRKACDVCVSQATTTPCFGAPGGACNYTDETGTCNSCKLLRRPCTFTSDRGITSIRTALQTDGKYGSLGIGTNIQLHAGNKGVVVQPIEEPFDPSLELENEV